LDPLRRCDSLVAIVAVTSPLLGAIADRAGARKKFMLAYTAMCLVGVLMMGPIHVRGMRMDTAANTPTPIRK